MDRDMTLYYAARNSDSTEGKGADVIIGIYKTEAEAEHAAKGKGVMGVGNGAIYVQQELPFEQYGQRVHLGQLEKSITFGRLFKQIYGYRKNWLGKWDYGWLDLRDAPTNDPEYDEFIRLQKKFGG